VENHIKIPPKKALTSLKMIKVKLPYLKSIILAVIIGGIFELIQFFIPGRYLSYTDMLLNSVGALFILPFKKLFK